MGSSGKKDGQPKRNWSTLPRKFGPQSWGTLPSKKSTEGRNTLPRKFGSENWSKFVAKDGTGGQQLVQSDFFSGPVLPRRNSMSSQSSNLGRGSKEELLPPIRNNQELSKTRHQRVLHLASCQPELRVISRRRSLKRVLKRSAPVQDRRKSKRP